MCTLLTGGGLNAPSHVQTSVRIKCDAAAGEVVTQQTQSGTCGRPMTYGDAADETAVQTHSVTQPQSIPVTRQFCSGTLERYKDDPTET